MATNKRGKKKTPKAKPPPTARKSKPAAKKAALQSPRAAGTRAAAATGARKAADVAQAPALLTLTVAGLAALRTVASPGGPRSGAKGKTAAVKRDKSLADALDRLNADYTRLLR